MIKTNKTKKMLLYLFSAVLSICIGIICFNSVLDKETAYADSGSFNMVQGISLKISSDSDEQLGRVIVNISPEIYSKLTQHEGDSTTGWWFWEQTWAHIPGYYLRLSIASSVSFFSNSQVGDKYEILYHLNPDKCKFPATQIKFNNNNTQAYLEFELPQPFNQEFYYYVDLVSFLESGSNETYDVNSTANIKIKSSLAYFKGRTDDYVCRSLKYVAEMALDDEFADFTDDEIRYLQSIAGFTPTSSTFTVNVKYKECIGFNDIRDKTISKNVDSTYTLSKHLVFSSIQNLIGFNNISYFNCVYSNVISFYDGTVYETDSRIILQATGYTYSFNSDTGVGEIVIIYSDYNYSDFCIKLTDNDTDDNINLSMYIYSTEVVSESQNRCTMVFDFSTIIHRSFTSLGWIFELEEDSFSVVNNTSSVTTDFENDTLEITFNYYNQNDLMNLSITAVAEIIPDYECEVNVNYKDVSVVNGDIDVSDNTFTESMMYSDLIKIYNSTTFINRYRETIDEGLIIEGYPSLVYYEYNTVNSVKTSATVYTVSVNYTYNTVIKIYNSINDTVNFYNLTKNSLVYVFGEFNYSVPSGYRVANLEEPNSDYLTIEFNELEPEESSIVVNTSVKQELVIKVKATLSDKWPVKINYLKRYNDSSFATLETFNGEISFADYPDLDEIDGDDIETIIGEENVKHLVFNQIPVRIVDSSITYTKTGNSFEFNFDYTYTYIKGIDSDGNSDYFNVPLTPFSKWCESFGEEWSIVALAPDVFTYSDEVEKDKLYGFFTVMTFKEQVKDFNSWFRNYTSSGCCTFFSQKEIKGSEFYVFMQNNPLLLPIAGTTVGLIFGHPVIGTAVGGALEFGLLSSAEAADDENGTYYSYFLYLDGSTTESYSAHNGADDYDDESGAFANAMENLGDSIIDWFNNSQTGRILKIILIVLISLVLLGLVLRVIGFFFKGVSKASDSIDKYKNRKK